MVEHNNAIQNAVPVEEAMLLLATALEGRLEESDRPRLEQEGGLEVCLMLAPHRIFYVTQCCSRRPTPYLHTGRQPWPFVHIPLLGSHTIYKASPHHTYIV